MKIKKGDNVIILTGKDRGKSGTVFRALPRKGKVIVEGVNIAKRHRRGARTTSVGQIVEKPMPISVSNVAVKGAGGKASRVGYTFENGKKTRIAKKGGTKL